MLKEESVVNMKHLNEYVKESLLDVDDFDLDDAIKNEIKSFIKANYKGISKCKISKNPNKDGKYVVDSKSNVLIKDKNVTNLTNDLFVWGEVSGDFCCYWCPSLTSLEGAPKKVGGNFASICCDSLTSLEGAPEEVGGNFECYNCYSLTSLKGAPKKVDRNFNCTGCPSLTTLNGVPKEVGGNFYCYECGGKFIVDDIKKVSNVKGIIKCYI